MDSDSPIVDFGASVGRIMTIPLARILLGHATIFAIGLVQGLRFGFDQRDYLFLVIGSIVSLLCAFAYGCVGIARANGREKRPWMLIAIMSGFLSYLFLLYITFYRGAWQAIGLFSNFSWASLFVAFLFITIGLLNLKHLQKVTDIVRHVRAAIEPA